MFYGFNKEIIKMRFRLGRSKKMHKGILTTLCCIVAIQCVLIPETNGLTNLRLRVKQFATSNTSTTPTPALTRLSSVTETTKSPLSPSGKVRRKRIRVKKIRVDKRQGELSEEVQNVVREPLYQDHQDEINVPEHYYSPIKRRRMRGRGGRLFKQGLQQVHQEFQNTLQETNPDSGFTRKGSRNRELEVDRDDPRRNRNQGQDDHSEEYASQTQPPPKNYAFAYAVKDGSSHKEARDGKLTMGEYRTNLPDGRTQIVRYTAGGNIGYKADITYEGEQEDPGKAELLKKPKGVDTSSPPEKNYFPPGLSDSASSTPTHRPRRKQRYKKYRNSPSDREDEERFDKYGASPSPAPREREHRRNKYGAPSPQPPTPGYVEREDNRRPKYGVPSPTPVFEREPRPKYEVQHLPKPTQGYEEREEPKTYDYGSPPSPTPVYEQEKQRRNKYEKERPKYKYYNSPSLTYNEEPRREYDSPPQPSPSPAYHEEPRQEYSPRPKPRQEYGGPLSSPRPVYREEPVRQEYDTPPSPRPVPRQEYGSPSSTRRPIYREQQRHEYEELPTQPPTQGYEREQRRNKYGRPTSTSAPKESYNAPSTTASSYSEREDPTSYDKYDHGQKMYYPRPQPTSTLSPKPIYRRPRPTTSNYEGYPQSVTPSPIVYSSDDDKNIERQRRPKPSPSPKYGRPNSIFDKMPVAEEKEYKGNLEFLHDKSPRAGPDRDRPIKRKPASGGGGYSYAGQQELEQEIDTLKKNYNPAMFDYHTYEQNKAKRKKKPSPKVSMAPPALYNEPGPGNYYSAVSSSPSSSTPPQFPQYPKPVYRSPSPTPSFNYIDDHIEQGHVEVTREDDGGQNKKSFGTYTPINFKSKSKELIPIEDFKAGPSRQKSKKPPKSVMDHPSDAQEHFFDRPKSRPSPYYSTPKPQSGRFKEPFHYFNSQHSNYQHGGYTPPATPAGYSQQPIGEPHPQPQPSPPDTSYTIDFPGGKHSFYIKTGSGSQSSPKSNSQKFFDEPEKQQFHTEVPPTDKRKNHPSGLVFFQTPGVGPRPTDLGVKQILDQLPNMPQSYSQTNSLDHDHHTTIHPYEVGSKDYGHSVSYKNSFNTPSSIEHEHNNDDHREEHHHEEDRQKSTYPREYLLDNSQDRIITPQKSKFRMRPNPAKSTPTPPPLVFIQQYHYQKSPSPSPQAFQDIDYQQPSPTPALSTAFFSQPLHSQQDYSTTSNFNIDPRHAGGQGALDLVGEQPPNLFYQYEENVK